MSSAEIACLAPIAIVATLVIWLWVASGRAAGTDWGSGWTNRIDGFNRLFCRYYHRLAPTQLPIPESGPALVVANHLSGIDAMLLIASSSRPLRFLIAIEEYRRPGLTWLFRAAGCIPVERGSRPEKALRAAQRALENGEVIALFPHGRIHLDSDPPRPLKKGFAYLASAVDCPVIPVRIDGVGAAGHIVRGVFYRSRARLTVGAPVRCRRDSWDECLAAIAAHIEQPRPAR